MRVADDALEVKEVDGVSNCRPTAMNSANRAVMLQAPSEHNLLVRLTIFHDLTGSSSAMQLLTTAAFEDQDNETMLSPEKLQELFDKLFRLLPPDIAESALPFTASQDALQLVCHKVREVKLSNVLNQGLRTTGTQVAMAHGQSSRGLKSSHPTRTCAPISQD